MSQSEKSAKKVKEPWLTKAAMVQVYHQHLWGGSTHDFYSGEGSHHKEIVAPYVRVIHDFLTSFKTPLIVCDLGCGDFNVGNQLVRYTQQYIAVDIVPDLITRNRTIFKAPNLSFTCLDIAIDNLPKADCVIIRQVLQHLSNQEIKQVVQKLQAYKYVILTEHLPVGDFVPNKDIISGQGIRIKKKSGVQLLQAPFNFKVQSEKEILSYVLENNKGKIVTTLFTIKS